MSSFKPRLPAPGLVPPDLIADLSAARRRGRPRQIPKSSSISNKPKSNLMPTPPSTPSRKNNSYKVNNHVSLTQTPSKSPSGRFSSSPSGTPSKRSDDEDLDGLFVTVDNSAAFTKWIDESQTTRDLHLNGDLAVLKPRNDRLLSFQPPRNLLPIPGVRRIKGFLKASLKGLEQNDEYQAQDIVHGDIIRFFDSQKHDYNIITHTMSDMMHVEWLDGPGLYPADVRARRVRFHIDPRLGDRLTDSYVWRMVLTCNNFCQTEAEFRPASDVPNLGIEDHTARQLFKHAKRVTNSRKRKRGRVISPEEEDEDSNADKDQEDEDQKDNGDPERREDQDNEEDDEDADDAIPDIGFSSRAKRRMKAPSTREQHSKHDNGAKCGAICMIEMTLAQCLQGKCTIYTKKPEYHPPASSLRVSPYIRRLLHETSSSFAMTKSRLIAWYGNFLKKHDTHATRTLVQFPDRLPEEKDYSTAIVVAQRSERLDANPLAAIEIMSRRNPEAFLRCRYPPLLDSDHPMVIKKSDRFECVVSSPYCLATALLQVYRMGLFMDSSWRHKNDFRCPLTMLVTLNQHHRMIPLAAMVSNHADEEAYVFLLETFRDSVLETARRILDGSLSVKIASVSPGTIREACRAALQAGFYPAFMMIDASDAERNAIEHVFPNVTIRVCQFHFMQAFQSRCKRVLGRHPDVENRTYHAMEAVRRCQRCRSSTRWEEYYQNFQNDLKEITDEAGAVLFTEWLDNTWFSDRWRKYVVDYGMPSYACRNGGWSTNNYSESMFRTFDWVFLNCRTNRRLDRLISILVHVYFPYYESVPSNRSRAPPELRQMLNGGLHRWETDCIRVCPIEKVPAAHRDRFRGTVYCVLSPRRSGNSASPPSYCGHNRDDGSETCTCVYTEQTAKRCVHLWAMVTFELCGPIMEFEQNSAVISEAIVKGCRNGHVLDSSDPHRSGPFNPIDSATEEGSAGDRSSKQPRTFSGSKRKRDSNSSKDESRDQDFHQKDNSKGSDIKGFENYWHVKFDNLDPLANINLAAGPDEEAEQEVEQEKESEVERHIQPLEDQEEEDDERESDEEAMNLGISPIGRRYRFGEQVMDSTLLSGKGSEATDEIAPIGRTFRVGDVAIHPGRLSDISGKGHRLALSSPTTPPPHERSAKVSVHPQDSFRLDVQPAAPELAASRESVQPVETHRNIKPGPAPAIQPKDPYRSKSAKRQPSSLTKTLLKVRKRKMSEISRPTGLANTGIDCYALALFQILMRQQSWASTLSNVLMNQSKMGGNLPFLELLGDIQKAIKTNTLKGFLNLTRILANEHLVDSAHSMQDPLELFSNMTSRLDEIAGSNAFSSLSRLDMIGCFTCAGCESTSRCPEIDHEGNSVMVYPNDPQVEIGNASVQELLKISLRDEHRTKFCTNKLCNTSRQGQTKCLIRHESPLLCIEVVWDLGEGNGSETAGDSASVSANSRFAIPRTLDFDTNWEKRPEGSKWQLAGILCRVGHDVDSGHYVAIVPQASMHWVIDDSIVTETLTPGSEAFRAGRYPVFIMYEKHPREAVGGNARSMGSPDQSEAHREEATSSLNEATLVDDSEETEKSRKTGGSMTAEIEDFQTPRPESLPITLPSNRTGIRQKKSSRTFFSPEDRLKIVPWRTFRNSVCSSNPVSLCPSDHFRDGPPRLLSKDLIENIIQAIKQSDTIGNRHGKNIRTKAQYSSLDMEELRLFFSKDEWWNNFIIDAVCSTAQHRAERLNKPVDQNEQRVVYIRNLIIWSVERQQPILKFPYEDDLPWPNLGNDATWRKRTSVSVVSVAWQTHFIAVVVFGPQRLVVPYDGAGGRYDCNALRKKWTTLLQDRLDYEEEQGWVTARENEHWIFMANSESTRARVGWVRQTDIHSCGPLSAALAITALQGARPEAISLGADSEVIDEERAIRLRDSILALYLGEAALADQVDDKDLGQGDWSLVKSVGVELVAWSIKFNRHVQLEKAPEDKLVRKLSRQWMSLIS